MLRFNHPIMIKMILLIHDFRYGIIDSSYRNPQHGMAYPCRAMVIIDPHKIVRMMSYHPWSMGRSTEEIIRTLDSLQLTQHFEHKVLPFILFSLISYLPTITFMFIQSPGYYDETLDIIIGLYPC